MFLVFRAFVSHPQDFLCVFICVVSFAFFAVVVCAGVLDMFTCYALSLQIFSYFFIFKSKYIYIYIYTKMSFRFQIQYK